MGSYKIRSEPLGIEIDFDSDRDVTEEDVFSLLKSYVPPQKMLDAYVSKGDEGQKLALQAFQNGFFEEEEEGPGLWSVIGDAAGMMTRGGYKATMGGNQTTTWLRQLNQAMGQPPAKREYADWEQAGIEKAANVFRGYVGTIGTSAVFQGIPILFGAKPKDIPIQTALENAFKTAGLPLNDRGLRQKVVSEAVKLDAIQRRATRYQGTAEAMTGFGLIGAAGKEYGKRAALDKWRGIADPERLDELDARAQLDYLVDQYDIMEKMEKGAQTVAQSGGSLAYMGKFISPKFQPFEPDLETYSAIVEGTVKPDPEEAFFLGMVSSPDVVAAPLIASGVKIPYRMVTSSAIKKQAASVLNHRKAVHHFKEQIRRAEAAGITGKGVENARNLLPVAENNLTAATAKFEKLVGRSVPAAQKVVGADAAQMAALQATARGSKEVIDGLKKLDKLTPVQTKTLANEEAKFALAETRLKALNAKAGPLRQAVAEAMPDPKAPIITKALGKTLQGAGIPVEYVGRMVEYLHRFTEEQIATLAQKTMRISGDEALKLAKVIKRPLATLAVLGGVTGGDFIPSDLGEFLTVLLTSQKGAQIVARMGSDINLIGKQYAYARNTIQALARFSQLPDEDRAFTDIVLDRTDDLTFGETASDLTRILNRKTRQFQPGPISRGIAQGMTRTGMAQSIDALGRGVRGTAEAVALPAGIGYAAGGEEGAAMAVGASLPLIAGGFGFGALMRYAPAELTAKQMADLQYYKKELLPIEEAEQFGKLPKALQIAVSSLSNEHPDVMFTFDDTKPSFWVLAGGESKININRKDGRASMALLAHEVGHHIDWHGATPQVLEAILGSYEKGKEGYYTIRITDNMSKKRLAQIRKHLSDEYGHHGEILTDDNGIVIVKDDAGNSSYAHDEAFAKHRIEYLEALDKDPLISDDGKKEYRNSPERIARELFAEHVADDIVTGGNVARNHRGVGSRLMIALGRTLVHNNVVRKLMHKMGIPSLDSGKIVGNRVFNELDKIPALQRIIEKYNKDVLGASRESRRSGRGRRVVDPEHPDEYADMVFTMEELKDPNNLQKLKDAGVLETDPKTGAIATNAFGEPIFLPTREIKKRNRQLASEVIEAIKAKENRGDVMPEGHLTVERAVDGKEYATGRYLSEDIINKLADSGKYSQGQIQMLRDMNKALRDQDGDAFDLFYYAALGWQRGRKVYKSIKGGNRRSLPFGIRISKDGNILIETVSYDKVIENLEWFAKHRKGDMGKAFHQSNARANVLVAENLLPRFLQNHMDGIENGTEGSGITNEQAYLLNAALGRINEAQVSKNPRLAGLGNKKSQRMASYRSRRLDRIGDSERVEADMPINPSAIMEGKMPAADDPAFMPRAADDDTVPLPFIEDLPGDKTPAEGFKRVVTQHMGKKELEAWENLKPKWGTKAPPFIPRFGDEGKQFMPAMNLADDFIADVVVPLKQEKAQRSQILQSIDRSLGRSFAKDIGLIDFLEGKKSVSKAELETFIRENTPELEVEVLGGREEGRTLTYQEAEDSITGQWPVEIWKDGERVNEVHSQWGLDQWKDDPDVTFKEYVTTESPKFTQHQEPGGTNPREIVVRLKRKEGEGTFPDELHYGDNVLLWLRMNERVDPDGKRVYFIEEIQSNWHQNGKKRGYDN